MAIIYLILPVALIYLDRNCEEFCGDAHETAHRILLQ